ncbi:RNA polymerase sigma-70 factor [Chitinophaga niabensis]|uniref:RNA polymerase sigma-70 factor n=1 Tax=Chitinophaga niabensis TaxID=536979 RepID=UPI0031BB7A49
MADKMHLSTLWQNICQHDDQKSFEALFHLCYQRLVRFSMEYVHSHQVAEEIVSDLFLKLWTGRQSFREVVHIEKYLFTAIRNQSLNHMRKYSAYRVISTEDSGEEQSIIHSFDPSHATEWKELLTRLDEAIEMLPPGRRQIFRLIKEEGFKPREVAEILNLSHRTVETQLFKAVKQLHTTLQPYLTRQKTTGSMLPLAILLAALLQ